MVLTGNFCVSKIVYLDEKRRLEKWVENKNKKMEMERMKLGSRVRLARQAENISLQDIASQIDVDVRELEKIENGEQDITALQLGKMSKILQVPILFFYENITE